MLFDVVYTGDAAVMANGIEETQSAANSWNDGTKQNEMKINTRMRKTEFMTISRSPKQYDVFIGQNKMNQTENYSCLGVCVNDGNLQGCEISERISRCKLMLA